MTIEKLKKFIMSSIYHLMLLFFVSRAQKTSLIGRTFGARQNQNEASSGCHYLLALTILALKNLIPYRAATKRCLRLFFFSPLANNYCN